MHGQRAMRLAAWVTAAAAMAVPATASAQTTVTFDGSVKQAGKQVTLKLAGGQKNADGSQPPTVKELALYFPRGASIDQTGLPKCTTAMLEAKGVTGCPKAARIGTGSVTARAGSIIASPSLTLFGGGKGKILLFVLLTSPLDIATPIEAKLTPASGPYGLKLTIPVPQNLQRPLNNLPAAITDISATVGKLVPGGKGRKRSLLSQGTCPASGKLAFKAVLIYAEGGSQEATDEQAC